MTRFLPNPAHCTLVAMALGAGLAAAEVKTGPAVGQRVPAFQLTDQNGKPQTFETLRGPKGLVLVFVRSADW